MNPLSMVVDELDGQEVVAVGDQTWAVFLLGLQDALHRHQVHPGGSDHAAASDAEGRRGDLLAQGGRRCHRSGGRAARRRQGSRSRTERQLAATVAEWAVEEGHDTAGFAIVASGSERRLAASFALRPHHRTRRHRRRRFRRSDRRLLLRHHQNLRGGRPVPTEVEAAYRVLEESQRTGVEAVKPGTPAAEIDAVTRGVIEKAGMGDL